MRRGRLSECPALPVSSPRSGGAVCPPWYSSHTLPPPPPPPPPPLPCNNNKDIIMKQTCWQRPLRKCGGSEWIILYLIISSSKSCHRKQEFVWQRLPLSDMSWCCCEKCDVQLEHEVTELLLSLHCDTTLPTSLSPTQTASVKTTVFLLFHISHSYLSVRFRFFQNHEKPNMEFPTYVTFKKKAWFDQSWRIIWEFEVRHSWGFRMKEQDDS